MPIDPRMMAQVQALRAQGGPTGVGPVPPAMQMGQANQPVGVPGAPAPAQSGLGLPLQVTPQSAELVRGVPQAQERFSQGQRQGVQADELRASASEPVMGKMVGRVYVPASIAQHGAKLMERYVAEKKEQMQKSERAGAKETEAELKGDWLDSLELTAPPAAPAGRV